MDEFGAMPAPMVKRAVKRRVRRRRRVKRAVRRAVVKKAVRRRVVYLIDLDLAPCRAVAGNRHDLARVRGVRDFHDRRAVAQPHDGVLAIVVEIDEAP